jgi:hypothetical protein
MRVATASMIIHPGAKLRRPRKSRFEQNGIPSRSDGWPKNQRRAKKGLRADRTACVKGRPWQAFGEFQGSLPLKTAWWAREDSNLQPDRYERSALTVELRAH